MRATSEGCVVTCPGIGSGLSRLACSASSGGTKAARGTEPTASSTRGSETPTSTDTAVRRVW